MSTTMTINSQCPTCEVEPFTRNHYFTGKLLLERDFTTEQNYVIDKLRHHHSRLHGWGAVCGLKVIAHERPECRHRFVHVEPGTAIDCCGREIIVPRRESIDIMNLPAIKQLQASTEPARDHVLQICVRYRECPTEEIPVLYDECGCDDTRCEPNRVLESYEFDVLVDAPLPPPHTCGGTLELRDSPTLFAHVSRVALHEGPAGNHLYMLVGDAVYQADSHTQIGIDSLTLPAKGLEMALTHAGDFLFVVIEPPAATPAGPKRLAVLNTSGMTLVRPEINIPNSGGSEVRLLVGPDGRLYALVVSTGDIVTWAPETGGAAPAQQTFAFAAGLKSIDISGDGARLYGVGTPDRRIKVRDLVANTTGDLNPTFPNTAQLDAVVIACGGNALAIIDGPAKKLYLVDLASPTAHKSAGLAHGPIALIASPDTRRVYVLERNGDASYVQAVDAREILDAPTATPPPPPPAPIQVGNVSQQIIISPDGDAIYVPFLGDINVASDGGVAKLEVVGHHCGDILWSQLDKCPECKLPHCVVLATIERYRVGHRIEDLPAPSPVPANTAYIDNKKGRRLLPSTQVLTELLQCMVQCGGAGGGPPGPQGPQGPQGNPGVGTPGAPGAGLEEGLTRIQATSWEHTKDSAPARIRRLVQGVPSDIIVDGIVIVFTAPVHVTSPNRSRVEQHVFEVLARERQRDPEFPFFDCRCPLRGEIIPVTWDPNNPLPAGPFPANPAAWQNLIETAGPTARGVAFILDDKLLERLFRFENTDLWVRLRGDFVIDLDDRAVDAEFVRAELPTGNRPNKLGETPVSKLGIQGGLFESWFNLVRGQQPFEPRPGGPRGVRVPVNTARRADLVAVEGIGQPLADAIMKERRTGRFTGADDFRRRLRLTDEQMRLIEPQIHFD